MKSIQTSKDEGLKCIFIFRIFKLIIQWES